MTKTLWWTLVISIVLSVLYWPIANPEVELWDLIEKERAWQVAYLGVDVMQTLSVWGERVMDALLTNPFGQEQVRAIHRTSGSFDRDLEIVSWRIFQTPYFRGLYALIVLSIGRLLCCVYLSLLLVPILVVFAVDGWVAARIAATHFKSPNSTRFRIAEMMIFVCLEAVIVVSLLPIWISPDVILIVLGMMGMAFWGLLRYWYPK